MKSKLMACLVVSLCLGLATAQDLGTSRELPLNTTPVGYLNDYDEECPYGGYLSPDVVYSFTPDSDVQVDVDLCGSGYDTKT